MKQGKHNYKVMKSFWKQFLYISPILIFFGSIFFNSCATYKKSVKTKINSKKNIKSIEILSYELDQKSNDIVKSKLYRTELFKYDKKGNLIEKSRGKDYGVINEKRVYTYNKDGEITHDSIYNKKGKLIHNIYYEYDDKGNNIVRLFYDEKQLYDRYEYTYNKKGYLTEFISSNKEGIIGNKRTFLYNKKGEMIRENKFDSYKGYEIGIAYKYDKNGYKIEEKEYDKNRKLKFIKLMTYDEHGNMITEVGHVGKTKTLNIAYKYDEKGNMIEEVLYKIDGSLDSKQKYSYDEKNNVIEDIWMSQRAKYTHTYAYKCNKKDDWVEKIEYKEGKPFYLIERRVEYHK